TPKEAKKGREHLPPDDDDSPEEEEVEPSAYGQEPSAYGQPSAQTTASAGEITEPSQEHGLLSGDEQVALDDYDHIVDGMEEFEQYTQDIEGKREINKPLKAPRAVLKMLRFPEREQPEIFDEQPTVEDDDMSAAVASMEEEADQDSDLENTYPLLTETEPVDDQPVASMQETAAGEQDQEQSEYAAHKREQYEMERLHQDFVKQMRSTIAENEEFGVHLGLEIEALDQDARANNVEERRRAILGSLKKLSDSHAQLAKKFDTAQTYLSIIESDKQKLSDELDRARKLSLTDDLTALPNRRAFMRRMDDEVSRVKRYGFPLSLVLIDIDHFKQVNDEYGHNAGDAVLRVYAEKILSVFRHHDMIARYGGEEFAVLLPNTDLEGVMRALDKVKNTVPDVKCSFGAVTITAPTFSAGVAEYHIPETPTQFIERADHALYRSKRLGRNRIEVEHADHEHGLIDHT
ncbi:MAG: diguanylate cyclase, partial [Gammaproteobacteria bacterium]